MLKTATNDIRFLSDFRESRCLMTKEEYELVYGSDDFHEDTIAVLQYGYECGYRIDVLKGGKYCLNFERVEYISSDLRQLEEIFWHEFVKSELGR